MKTPREKYMNDLEYHRLVDMLEQFVETARFSPSELREACRLILACLMRSVCSTNLQHAIRAAGNA